MLLGIRLFSNSLIVEYDNSRKYSILIIDDEEALRYSLRRALANRTFNVLEADSGEAGIEVAKAESPDIILLDNHVYIIEL